MRMQVNTSPLQNKHNADYILSGLLLVIKNGIVLVFFRGWTVVYILFGHADLL